LVGGVGEGNKNGSSTRFILISTLHCR
jgi:hypothetical protein